MAPFRTRVARGTLHSERTCCKWPETAVSTPSPSVSERCSALPNLARIGRGKLWKFGEPTPGLEPGTPSLRVKIRRGLESIRVHQNRRVRPANARSASLSGPRGALLFSRGVRALRRSRRERRRLVLRRSAHLARRPELLRQQARRSRKPLSVIRRIVGFESHLRPLCRAQGDMAAGRDRDHGDGQARARAGPACAARDSVMRRPIAE